MHASIYRLKAPISENVLVVLRFGTVMRNVSPVLAHLFLTRSLTTPCAGQNMHWQMNHKKICKVYNTYISSTSFEALAAHAKMDGLLLSHLLAGIDPESLTSSQDESSSAATFMSLLSGPDQSGPATPPIPRFKKPLPPSTVEDIYSKFGNNNFTIHSHLNSVGHGIFPLASRFFNHSCAPNAASRYIFSPATPVTMEVVALRDIKVNEEVGFQSTSCVSFCANRQSTDMSSVLRSRHTCSIAPANI
jgi:hypothetical protein